MALSLKNPETERLARELAAATGETVTTAVTLALQEGLRAVGPTGTRRDHVLSEVRRIGRDAGGRWPPHLRDVDHGDLLYDDRGLPR